MIIKNICLIKLCRKTGWALIIHAPQMRKLRPWETEETRTQPLRCQPGPASLFQGQVDCQPVLEKPCRKSPSEREPGIWWEKTRLESVECFQSLWGAFSEIISLLPTTTLRCFCYHHPHSLDKETIKHVDLLLSLIDQWRHWGWVQVSTRPSSISNRCAPGISVASGGGRSESRQKDPTTGGTRILFTRHKHGP